MTNKMRGTRAEWELMSILRRQHYTVSRSGSSFSAFDLTACKKDRCLHIQVKRVMGTYINFKREIEQLEQIEVPTHCEKWLFVRLDRQGSKFDRWSCQRIHYHNNLKKFSDFIGARDV